MATEFLGTFGTSVDCSLDAGAEISGRVDSVTAGVNDFPSLAIDYTDGTSSNQAKTYFIDSRALAATTTESLDLAGSLADPFGTTITFTVIKEIVIAIVSPDGSKKLRVGPQNVANAWQGPFGGTGATVYIEFFHHWKMPSEPYTGYTVTAGTGDLLVINNPTASSITYGIIIVGET